jgi:predicted TIM-barrel fold metal-dependent hydrolase
MPIATANLRFRPQVPIFDAHVCVGSGRSEIGLAADRPALLAELDRNGVARALVYHAHAEEFSPVLGNTMLQAWLGDDGRLEPLWSAMPTEESLAQLQVLHAAKPLRAVRLTRAQGLPFADWTHAALLEWLAAEALPLWIALPDMDAHDLVSTLRSYKQLPVVIAGAHYSDTLLTRKLLAALPNAYLELSRFEALDAINDLIARFGAKRLLYGSWYPRYAIGPMLYFIHHCGLPEALLAQICAGNLNQLLNLPEGR